MVQVVFIESNGNRRTVDARPGDPLMHAARDAGIAGIIAECGGSAMCATCVCDVIEAAEGALGEIGTMEADTIEFMAHQPGEASRLTCQITVTPALEGAVFRVATGR